MLRTRIIPCLQLHNESLIKTVQYGKYSYIGDPVNTCRIFNELEVDELVFLDIYASKDQRGPNFKVLRDIVAECFMPLSYGGGINNLETAEKLFKTGFEKVIINTASLDNPQLINDLAKNFGNQSVIVAIDLRKDWLGKYFVYGKSGTVKYKRSPVEWAKEVQDRGAGEILLTSIDMEGTWKGFDFKITKQVSDSVFIPVIANGGAGNLDHIEKVIKESHASAVALGSMVVFQQKDFGVLVNFPDIIQLRKKLN